MTVAQVCLNAAASGHFWINPYQGIKMSIFGSILSTLGFGDKEQVAQAQAPAAATPVSPETAVVAPAAPVVSEVDVLTKLTDLATANVEPLNWQTSIVDLLKLLGLDSSLAARKELARELACPADTMNDSAQMNMWLHKTVMQKLAQNGGNIPADLLH